MKATNRERPNGRFSALAFSFQKEREPMIPGQPSEFAESAALPVRRTLRVARLATLIAGLSMATGAAFSQVQPWNLPYIRPANYNYSALYADDLNTYIASNPYFFKDRLKNAWTYWKANFMMSSGLVNHRRLEGTSVIGTNEAVSEGQGYGMLLSVLMNDQPTFNKIFEAANSQLWDGGKKSYKWVLNGSSGAATDADLDIGLALVFADELVKAKAWQTYSGSVSYNTRAMDIIRSIKNNMTSQNYLLPGDTWGGEGINNQNPSYFATAWLKIFNKYQSEVDFTAVIDNCYAVLAKTPKYSLGQAPDWCNMSGQQASQASGKPEQGLGMLSDGIRTPYRIGLDAIWFKDARAIAYCKNTAKTLTEINNANITLLAAQMAQYKKDGTPVLETKGSFDNMTMWMTAVIGSGDPVYAKAGTKSLLFSRIIGTLNTYLGTNELRDDVFYYKQSIAMLGFAAIGGQFPNLQADTKTVVSIHLTPKAGATGNRSVSALNWGSSGWFTPGGTSGLEPFRDAMGRAVLLTPTSGSNR
jgi:endo-1,4-beta-D-glucanase Y